MPFSQHTQNSEQFKEWKKKVHEILQMVMPMGTIAISIDDALFAAMLVHYQELNSHTPKRDQSLCPDCWCFSMFSALCQNRECNRFIDAATPIIKQIEKQIEADAE